MKRSPHSARRFASSLTMPTLTGTLVAALLNQKKPDDAIAAFREAIRLEPNDAGNHFSLGYALNSQEKTDEAITAFRETVRLKPDHADAYWYLGWLLNQKKPDDAITAFREAIQLEPNDAENHFSLGYALNSQEKQMRRSQRSARRFASSPTMPWLTGTLVTHYCARRSSMRPSPLSARPSGSNRTTLKTTSAWDTLCTRHEKLDDAIAAYREAIRLKPDYAEAHYNLGCVLYDQEKFDEAEAEFAEARRLKPGIDEEP